MIASSPHLSTYSQKIDILKHECACTIDTHTHKRQCKRQSERKPLISIFKTLKLHKCIIQLNEYLCFIVCICSTDHTYLPTYQPHTHRIKFIYSHISFQFSSASNFSYTFSLEQNARLFAIELYDYSR